uniref:Uncharacterized protein n=1 Tax=Myotis myotis TaxID=51298 RepID=A0A7J7RFQ2_MYOMY|nr:hypothetical protein mMyoMyo1_010357 [Myotis myotis]
MRCPGLWRDGHAVAWSGPRPSPRILGRLERVGVARSREDSHRRSAAWRPPFCPSSWGAGYVRRRVLLRFAARTSLPTSLLCVPPQAAAHVLPPRTETEASSDPRGREGERGSGVSTRMAGVPRSG